MPPVTDQAVVLRLSEFSETSQIATLFTRRSGQVRLIAKGIRRGTKTRAAVGLDLLELGQLTYSSARGEAGLGILAGWVQEASFSGLRRDLRGLYAGLYASELVAALTQEYDPHESLVEALVQTLGRLDQRGDFASAVAAFQVALLTAIGYMPDLTRCVDCGHVPAADAERFFSSTAGGLICRDCELHHVEKRHIESQICVAAKAGSIGAAIVPVLNYHLSHVAGRKFQTADNLIQALR